MDVEHAGNGRGLVAEPAFVDPTLYGNIRDSLLLEIALLGIAAPLTKERSLNIDRMRIVALDQVRVVGTVDTVSAPSLGFPVGRTMQQSNSTTVTREHLYQQVWQRPMQTCERLLSAVRRT
jgi:hypothetical protein